MTSEFIANYFWPNSFFRSLLFILPVMVWVLWDKLHLDKDRAKPIQLRSPDPHHFLSTPSSSPPLPSQTPREVDTMGQSGATILKSTIFVSPFLPSGVGCSLWCGFDQWNTADEVCHPNKKVTNHWDRPLSRPSLQYSGRYLQGSCSFILVPRWGDGNKGPRKAIVNKWHEQERHLPCYNPLQIWVLLVTHSNI